jgi:hypothetical protein
MEEIGLDLGPRVAGGRARRSEHLRDGHHGGYEFPRDAPPRTFRRSEGGDDRRLASGTTWLRYGSL